MFSLEKKGRRYPITSLTARDELSRHYTYQLVIESASAVLTAKDCLQQASVVEEKQEKTIVTGIITAIDYQQDYAGAITQSMVTLQASVVLLKNRQQRKASIDKPLIETISALLQPDYQTQQIQKKVKQDAERIPIQQKGDEETDYEWLARLCRQAGYYYYFPPGRTQVIAISDGHDNAGLIKNIARISLKKGLNKPTGFFKASESHDRTAVFLSAVSNVLGLYAGQSICYEGSQYLILTVKQRCQKVSDYQSEILAIKRVAKLNGRFLSKHFPYKCPKAATSIAKVIDGHCVTLQQQATQALLKITPYGQGSEFQSEEKTAVLLMYHQGHPDKPIIGHCLHDKEGSNPVAKANQREHRLESQYGNTLIFSDNKVTLANHEKNNLCQLEKEALIIKTQTGRLTFSAKQTSQLNCANYEERISANKTISAKEQCSLDSLKSIRQSTKDYQWQTCGDIRLTAGSSLLANAGGICWEVSDALQIRSLQGSVMLDGGGKLSFHCKQGIVLSGSQAKQITLQAGKSSIQLTSDGRITIKSPNILGPLTFVGKVSYCP